MPFKSTELFHYFYDLQDPADIAPKEKRQGLLKSVMQSPDALRNTMLIAGLHFAWNAGHLKNFEPTLLFHKIETMRLINRWLEESRPKGYWVCVRQIATLCLTEVCFLPTLDSAMIVDIRECCLGNVATAETHLDGLMRFMDFHKPPAIVCQDSLNVEDELSNRYIILTYNFIYGFKSRLQDIIDDDDRLGPNYQPTSTQVEEYMHAWHKEEFRGLEIRLKAMKMIPFFFSPLPPSTKFCDVDGSSMIDCLISLTETSRFRRQLSGDGQAQHLVWLEGAATRLLLAFVGAHIESLAGEGNGGYCQPVAPRLMASWSGLSTSVGLYLHAVLGFWNAGAPIEPRLHRRVLSILKRDLDHTACWTGRHLVSDFWFWRAFMGAFSLAKHARVGDQSLLEPLQGPFRGFIREWSRCSGVMEWARARESLVRIVWPEVFVDEVLAEELWDKSVL
ncbi:hypothetical protein ACJZ2D_011095 [Fusarium nematophilum]